MKYDYLIVGSGLFGSIFARQLTDAGAKCLIVEKRSHMGGNCYTRDEGGIQVHQYGAHIFHTNNKKIWDYVNQWVPFNHYKHRIKVNFKDNIYSFPINLMTLHQLWGVNTPEEARRRMEATRVSIKNPQNLEEWILSQVGEELYTTFVYGYTKKQWGCDPKELPSSIIKRIPIRLTYDDNYFNDVYQGIPIGGYTKMFQALLKDIPVDYGVDYMEDKEKLDSLAKKVVYTGALDEFFGYDTGVLDWRSLRFEEERHEGNYQGVSVLNYTEEAVPYTRILEHKHFDFTQHDHTFITKEYPQDWKTGEEKFYPITSVKNNELHRRYKHRIDNEKFITGGRLADYKYYDMHQVVGSALAASEKEIR